MLSLTVIEARRSGVRLGKPITANIRIEFQTPNRYTWTATEVTVGGEKQPDYTDIYTRVKATSDEPELIRLNNVWSEASKKNDSATLDRIWADDLTFSSSEGPASKREVLAWFKANAESGDVTIDSVTLEDHVARVYGDLGVTTGVITQKGREKGEDYTWKGRFTDTWIKQDGQWRCCAAHVSEISDTADDKATAAKLSPEMKKLEVLVGDWAFEGERMDPPFPGLPPAGKYSGRGTSRFVLDGSLLEAKVEVKDGTGISSAMGFMTDYDAKAKNYVESMFMSDGDTATSVMTVSPDGRIWTSRSTMTTREGKELLVKQVSEYSPDGTSSSFRIELSADDGKTWKLWLRDQGKKTRQVRPFPPLAESEKKEL